MDELWKWLMRTNARVVFFCSLGGLVGVTAWWGWRAVSPIERTKPPAATRAAPAVLEPLGLLAFLDEQLGSDVDYLPGNPYVKPDLGARHRRDRPPRVRTDRPPPSVGPEVTDPFATGTADKPPVAGPTFEAVSLTYRGVFRRTDGQALALLEDSKSQRRSFKGPGSELFGLTVGRVGETDLELIQQDTSPVTIELGTPVRFEDGQHVE